MLTIHPIADLAAVRRRRVRRAAFAWLGTFLAANAFLLVIARSFSITLGAGIGLYAMLRATRSRRLVVWLRRFHQGTSGALRFNRPLVGACWGIAVPVTIQDSSYKTSYEHGFTRVLLFYPLIMLGALLAMLTAGIGTLSLGDLGLPLAGQRGVMLVLSLVFFGMYAYALRRTLVRRGYAKLAGHKGLSAATVELEAIKNGKRHTYGIRIFSCDDSIWQQVVQSYVERADAIIIDVTNPSENVLWELKTAEQSVGAESIVLACGYDADPPELPEHARSMLASAMGTERLARCSIFFYPAHVAQSGPTVAAIGKAVANELAARLTAAFAAHDQRGEPALAG
jgi:hypothetical protein